MKYVLVKNLVTIASLFLLGMAVVPDVRADCNEINYVIWNLIANGSVEKLRSNLEKGKSGGCTPWPAFHNNLALVHAAYEGNYDAAKLLIEYGIDINAEDQDNNTALDYAVENRDTILMEMLLSCGVSVHWPAMRIALENGFDETVCQLATHFQEMDRALVVFIRGEERRRKFYQRDSELLEAIRVLIQNGADVNQISKPYTPLTALAWSFNLDHNTKLEIAGLLIDSGADVNKKDDWGDNALLLAAASNGSHYDYLENELIDDTDGNYEFVKLLLDRGASTLVVNRRDYAPPIALALITWNLRIAFLLAWQYPLLLTLLLFGLCIYWTAESATRNEQGRSQFSVMAADSIRLFAKVYSMVVILGTVLLAIILLLWLSGYY